MQKEIKGNFDFVDIGSVVQELPQTRQEIEQIFSELQQKVERQEQELQQKDKLIFHLQLTLDNIRRQAFGRKSERFTHAVGQLFLFGELAVEESKPGEPPLPERPSNKLKKSGGGRKKLPPMLERVRINHDVLESEKSCPCCGRPLVEIGEEISEQLERQPAKLFVIEHSRKKYGSCTNCHGTPIVTAPPAKKPIPKGIPGPMLLAWILTRKFRFHLPVYRIQQMLTQEGADLCYQTILGWIGWCAFLLEPISNLMRQELLKSEVVHTDDTSVRAINSKSETGKSRLWPYIGDEAHPHVVFDYTTSRKRDGPARFLEGYQGYLQADAYGGYDGLYRSGDIIEVACWAHARRKFFDCLKYEPSRAGLALGYINCLFRIERRAQTMSPEERVLLRQRKSRVVLEKLRQHLERIQTDTNPENQAHKAANYVFNQWDALNRFVDVSFLKIDNNAAERAIRPIAVGRKNWLFVVGDQSGKNTAILYSIIATCLRLGIDPDQYLAEALLRLATEKTSVVPELVPLNWKRQRMAAEAQLSPAQSA